MARNYKQAFVWLGKAAEQVNVDAQSKLGVMYMKGQGIPQKHCLCPYVGNLAASNGLENGGVLGDAAAKEISSADISAAQKLARKFIHKKYKEC